ncbi:MAG: hypothetical protein EHM70_24655 [Chloroflexota bacterium]|nr:MAG: hypothetical protein EHM70_24655 [Chloroflexota bacterium]
MSNRTQEQNDSIILTALRSAGDKGLSLDEVRIALFGNGEQSKSLTKKILERLKNKGFIRTKMGPAGLIYVILPGR